LEVLGEKILRQEGVEEVCRQAQKRKELFEFGVAKGESTEGSPLGC
jgi:hypothetical protein